MLFKTEYNKIQPYTTKDGSEIRELMHPGARGQGGFNLSLAEATVPAGATTRLHKHGTSDEIYHIQAGAGMMVLGRETFRIEEGHTILIPKGTPHSVENTERVPLRVLCCCSPPYAHDDTELLVPKKNSHAGR